MRTFFRDIREMLVKRRELMLLPLLVILLLLTAIMILNKDTAHTPFVYSGF